jgi:hypothetical protein
MKTLRYQCSIPTLFLYMQLSILPASLDRPRGTDFDIPAYIDWLDRGAGAYNR